MAGHDGERDDFRHVVRVKPKDGAPELLEARGGRFDEEERFAAPLDLALPPERGLNTGDDIHAGGDASLDEPLCEAARDSLARTRHEHHNNIILAGRNCSHLLSPRHQVTRHR